MTPKERYQKLQHLLHQENPLLEETLSYYQLLDKVGHKTGLLSPQESYAQQISWWPLISLLGTFSAGKSSFINRYLGRSVQTTGNQAVDDKFTVICHGNRPEITTLPGLALDSDPRFPFYGMSAQIEQVARGEGKRIDSYLQLKTLEAAPLLGKILIDSPGFDADSQRDATLRVTKHIIDLSDLVLVFFDARHPEPGAMRDTLEHLVAATRQRHDADKMLYVLNQIDTAAKEDNLEEIIGSWQRALSSQGLTGGNFYAIYNDQASQIEDPVVRARFAARSTRDLDKILQRIDKVGIERSYRITRSLETIAQQIEQEWMPRLQTELTLWRKRVLLADLSAIAALAVGWFLLSPTQEVSQVAAQQAEGGWGFIGLIVGVLSVFAVHFFAREKLSQWQQKSLHKQGLVPLAKALAHSTRAWRSLVFSQPRGWGSRSQKILFKVTQASKQTIQKLNDQFTNPSGPKTETLAEHSPLINAFELKPESTSELEKPLIR
ncbi:MAG: dynamin family protein [Thiotrichales bacterium]|nr:dynamin family protein [Thiotrichales bacterium]